MQKDLKIHFFTIVLNGMPFIKNHIENFKKITPQWHWHIIEGVAELKNDTAWSVANGGRVEDSFHKNGLSNDGTTEYLDSLKQQFPNQISIYRKPNGIFWNGKIEMVNAPLPSISEECLLWEVDVDEFWLTPQINKVHELFNNNPKKFAAFYYCNYFVGPDIIVSTRSGPNNPSSNWERTWRFLPHFRWAAHEPPTLVEKMYSGEIKIVRNRGIFSQEETEKVGLVFQHYAYVFQSQLQFKEVYYGYQGAVADWIRLQDNSIFPAKLSDFFKWVNDGTLVDKAGNLGIKPMDKLFDKNPSLN